MHLRLAALILSLCLLVTSVSAQQLTEEELFGTEDSAGQQSVDDIEKQIEKELSTVQEPVQEQQIQPPVELTPEPLQSAPEEMVETLPMTEPEVKEQDLIENSEISPPLPVEPEIVRQEPPAEELAPLQLETATLAYPKDVEVEANIYNSEPTKNCNCSFAYLKGYTERRSTFGFNLALGYSSYAPLKYKPDFVVNNTFENYYGPAETPMIEVTLGPKWNMALGSLILDLGAGYYNNENRDKGNLKLIPVRAGATLALDNIGLTPYIVPYASAGTYVVYYEEKLLSQKVGGNTSPGVYYGGGVAFQLNWLDETSASIAYDETGLENTYLYGEARSFVEATNIPNLGSEIQWGAGLRLEY